MTPRNPKDDRTAIDEIGDFIDKVLPKDDYMRTVTLILLALFFSLAVISC